MDKIGDRAIRDTAIEDMVTWDRKLENCTDRGNQIGDWDRE